MTLYLPKPTGPFSIGTTKHYLIDRSRYEEHTGGYEDTYRELALTIYYPTEQIGMGKEIGKELLLSDHLFLDKPEILKVLENVRGHAQVDARLLNTIEKLPVIIFSHGLGDPIVFYTSFLEDLASHGYIVIAVQHTYGCEPSILENGMKVSMPLGLAQFNKEIAGTIEQVLDHEHDIWVQDILFVISKLKNIIPHDSYAYLLNRLDLNRIGIFGHSFGGSVATALSRISNDIKAAANLDGVLWGSGWNAPANKPSLFLMAGHLPNKEEQVQAGFEGNKWQRILNRLPYFIYENINNHATYITIKHASHMSFSDLYYIKSLGQGDTTKQEQYIAQMKLLLRHFFDIYLCNKQSKLSDLIQKNSGDLTVETK